MRRLVHSAHRRPGTGAEDGNPRGTARRAAPAVTELPPYEPPSHPLSAEAQRELEAVLGPRDARKYEQHLGKAVEQLGGGVAGVHERLYTRRQRVAALDELVERRRQRSRATAAGAAGGGEGEGGEGDGRPSVADAEAQRDAQKAYLARLEADVTAVSGRAEVALRDIIDWRAELEDERAAMQTVLKEVERQEARLSAQVRAREAKRQRRQARTSDGDVDMEREDEEEQEEDQPDEKLAVEGASELLQTARRAKADEYARLGLLQRYGQNNDYISFKKIWHDAAHGDEGLPLPDASAWFDAEGKPVLTTGLEGVGGGNGGGEDGDDDDDIVVQREKIDLKCPLSLKTMTEPYSNTQCKHTFEKSVILEFIRGSHGIAKCPVCSKEFRASDFYADQIMLRKIKRAEEAARREADDDDDDDDDDPNGDDDGDGDASLIIGKSTNLKKERMRSRQIEDIDAD